MQYHKWKLPKSWNAVYNYDMSITNAIILSLTSVITQRYQTMNVKLKCYTKITYKSSRRILNNNVCQVRKWTENVCHWTGTAQQHEFWTWHFGLGLLLLDGQRDPRNTKWSKFVSSTLTYSLRTVRTTSLFAKNATSDSNVLQRNRMTEIGRYEFRVAKTEVCGRHCLFV